MPYISPIYKTTNNLNQYNSEETKKLCLEEEAKGNVPIIACFPKGGHMAFYASRDTTIDSMIASLQKTVNMIQLYTFNPKHRQYQSPVKITDHSKRIEQLSSEKKIQIVFWLAD